MEAARNLTGKEQERMNRLRKWIKNMKYRHKLSRDCLGADDSSCPLCPQQTEYDGSKQ